MIPSRNQKAREESRFTQTIKNEIGHAGVGYVVIPPSITPEEYIEDCYRTNTVTIWGGRGYGFFNGIHVTEQAMQDIQFPIDGEDNKRGSAVVWIKDDNSQLPVVIATIRQQDDFFSLEQNQFRLNRCIDDKRSIEVFVDAKTASMFVNIIGDNEEAADFNIKVVSENKDSVINVYSDNEIDVSAESLVHVHAADEVRLSVDKEGITQTKIICKVDEGKSSVVHKKIDLVVTDEDGEEQMHAMYEHETGFTYDDEFDNHVTCEDGKVTLKVAEDKAEFTYEKGTGFTYKDEFNNEIVCKDKEVDIKSQKIVETGDIQHNNGGEKMVKGDTLKGLLEELCGQVSDICTAAMAITVTCAMPGSPSGPPVNAAQFGAAQAQVNTIKGKLQQILSQKSTLD